MWAFFTFPWRAPRFPWDFLGQAFEDFTQRSCPREALYIQNCFGVILERFLSARCCVLFDPPIGALFFSVLAQIKGCFSLKKCCLAPASGSHTSRDLTNGLFKLEIATSCHFSYYHHLSFVMQLSVHVLIKPASITQLRGETSGLTANLPDQHCLCLSVTLPTCIRCTISI